MILPTRSDHLVESYSYRVVQPVKTSCPPTENINETPVIIIVCRIVMVKLTQSDKKSNYCYNFIIIIYKYKIEKCTVQKIEA